MSIDGRTLETDLAITCGEPRPTTMGVEGGVDVPVTVYAPGGACLTGEVTLAPSGDGRRVYVAYGSDAGHWVSGALLAQLERMAEGRNWMMRTYLGQLEAAASAKAGRVPR